MIKQWNPEEYYPRCPCPVSLVLNIVSINHLRAIQSDSSIPQCVRRDTAFAIFERVRKFSPDAFAMAHQYEARGWLLIARLYQSAVAIYCLASLEHLHADPQLTICRAGYGSLLLKDLQDAQKLPTLRMGTLWPTIIAGFENARGEPSSRDFVRKQLTQLGSYMGSALPGMALTILQSFWESGYNNWDQCFDYPSSFVT